MLGSIPGAPHTFNLKDLGGELYAVGNQAVLDNGSYIRKTLVVKWSGPVSVKEENAADITVYPNPVNRNLMMEGLPPNNRVTIIDVDGRISDVGSLPENGTLDVSHLANGLYLLRVETDHGVRSTPFVKK
jgi:hypothetical protein